MSLSRSDGEMASLVCVHGLFGGVEGKKGMHHGVSFPDVSEDWHVIFGFGGTGALFDLFHVTFLSFVRIWDVFGDSGGHETWNSGEAAIPYCKL